MKYRIHIWRSPTGDRPDAFGIQVQTKKGERFIHCCATVNDVHRALIYEKRKRAAEVVDLLSAPEPCPDISAGLIPLANPS